MIKEEFNKFLNEKNIEAQKASIYLQKSKNMV